MWGLINLGRQFLLILMLHPSNQSLVPSLQEYEVFMLLEGIFAILGAL